MFTQLHSPFPLHVLGKGPGRAIAVIDYGQDHNLIWVTAIDATGEIWCAPNPGVRMQSNWTMGRPQSPAVTAEGDGLYSRQASQPSHMASPTASAPCVDCADRMAPETL